MSRNPEVVRIEAFDKLLDAMRGVYEELGTPFNEEELVQQCHELIFEGSKNKLHAAIAALRQLAATEGAVK
jgi:hypothetical protein